MCCLLPRQREDRLRPFLHTLPRSDAARRLAGNLRRLTPREWQILQHMLRADTAEDIARNLGLAVSTTQNHRSHVLGKLLARNAVDLLHLVSEAPEGTRRLVAERMDEFNGAEH